MLSEILSLIVNPVVGLLATVLLLRFWMQVIRIRPPSQVAEFTFQLTDWLVLRLRRVVPGIGGYDWASLLATSVLAVLMATLDCFLLFGQVPLRLLLIMSVLNLITWICYGFIGLLILSAVFSWVNPHAPLAPFVRALTDPLLRPVRRFMPSMGGLDLSPMVVSILLIFVLRISARLLA